MSSIVKANLTDLNGLVTLFNEYRTFYRKELTPKSTDFLKERLEKNDSAIFIIKDGNTIAGFVQLYSSFSSLSLGRTWILNDLYISPAFRRKKFGLKLIEKSVEYARETNAVSLSLSTQISNTNAQELYKKFGFKKDNDFFYFNYATSSS